jgi:hypothetical protein
MTWSNFFYILELTKKNEWKEKKGGMIELPCAPVLSMASGLLNVSLLIGHRSVTEAMYRCLLNSKFLHSLRYVESLDICMEH